VPSKDGLIIDNRTPHYRGVYCLLLHHTFMTNEPLSAIRNALAAVANPGQSESMKAYMLHQFAFLGIRAEARRRAVREVWRTFPASYFTQATLLSLATHLWQLPEREYQYAAIDVLQWSYKKLTPQGLPGLLQLVQEKSWWDSVDSMAGLIGDILLFHKPHQKNIQQEMDVWLVHPCLWVRRLAMLHQLGWKNNTDATRLFHYALTLAPENDFFIRKAIGWALRDYARVQPEVIRHFLKSHESRLSRLTVREAGKHL
jgi:3-methyladenine DNA glycosylase AlkD